MKNDPFGRSRIKAQHLTQVPAYGFALTVFVSREPYFVRSFGERFEIVYDFSFFVGDDIAGLKTILHVDTHARFFEVTDMAIAAIHLKILTKDLLDGLCFGGALNY